MSKLALFKDLGKPARDLLSKEFSGDKTTQTVEWKGTSDGGVTVTAKLVKDAKASTVGTLIFEQKFADFSASFKNEVTTQHKCKTELKFSDVGTSGLNATVSTDAGESGVTPALCVEFANDTVAFNTSGKYAGAVELAAGLVLAHNGFQLAGAVNGYNVTKGDFADVRGWVGYQASDFEFAVSGMLSSGEDGGDDKSTTVGLTYFQKLSGDWKVGVDASYPIGGGDEPTKLAAGTEWSPAKGSTYKARIDTDAVLALAIKQQYSDAVTFSIGTSTDTNTATSKFGFSLNLSS